MKFFKTILTIFHLVVMLLLLGTLLNSIVSPHAFPYINLLSLAFPVLMILNLVLCLFWIILSMKRAILFIGLSLLFILPVKRWINWKSMVLEKPNLKVLTVNMKAGQLGREEIYTYLEKTNADVIFAQEYGSDFRVRGYEKGTAKYEIVAVNSKTRIIHQEKLETSGNGNAFYADIEFNGKIIRLVNVYLNPFSFEKKMVKPVEDFQENKAKLKDILRKLIPTFKIHQQEIRAIRKAVDDSPYPVILAGDFNSVPNSYEYYELGKGLTDAFVEVGRGSSTTFHEYKFPIRIDYIFTSREIRPINYRVDRSVKISDHFPVIAEFRID